MMVTGTEEGWRGGIALVWLIALLAGCESDAAGPPPAVLPPYGVPFDAPAPTSADLEQSAPGEGEALSSAGAPRMVPPAPPPGPAPAADGDAKKLGFTELASFEYEAEDPLASFTSKRPPRKFEIPAAILDLSGERVAVDGYLMPTIFESGRVKQFLLTRSYITCCFGDVLRMNEVIDVTVGPDLEVSYFLSGQPVTVTGWLEVGEKKSEFGYVESIYRIVAEKVAERW